MRQHFSVAPWSRSLKLTSLVGTVLILGVGVAAYRAIPTPTGFSHTFGLGVAVVFPVMLLVALFFMVTGYAVEGTDLHVERLLTSTRIPLEGLRRLWYEPTVCKGSLRVFGNAGLLSFTGLYQNPTLGRYRLFATHFARAVVLVLPQRVVVVTPAAPHAFIEYLHRLFPTAEVGFDLSAV